MASRFFWRGNDPGLDFLNTEVVDEWGAPLDLLSDGEALLQWLSEVGIVDAADVDACWSLPRRSATALLDWARRLRSTTRALVDPAAKAAGRSGPSDPAERSSAATAFSAVVAEVPVRLTAPAALEDDSVPVAPVTAVTPVDRVRLALALAAIDTLSLDRGRIRRCEGERCVLLYYDTSRNRSRRWCDMAACGNRAKAAAHYRRTRRAGATVQK